MTLHKHPIHAFMFLVEVSQLVMALNEEISVNDGYFFSFDNVSILANLVFLLFLILLDIIKVLIILVLSSLGLSLGLLPFLLVLLILHLLLGILGDGPQVLSGLLGGLGIVSDHEVVKDGSSLDLPQVEAELAHLVVLSNGLGLLLVVLGVVNLGVDPGSLVVGVVNLPTRLKLL